MFLLSFCLSFLLSLFFLSFLLFGFYSFIKSRQHLIIIRGIPVKLIFLTTLSIPFPWPPRLELPGGSSAWSVPCPVYPVSLLTEQRHMQPLQPLVYPCSQPHPQASQHKDIIQMLSVLVYIKEIPNWMPNIGRFSSQTVKCHLACTWLLVPFFQPSLLLLSWSNLCLCLSLSFQFDA